MDVQALLQEYIEGSDAVGASIGIIDHGTIKFFSYGKKALDENEMVTEDTVFQIGSITKVFTTLALMDMADKGQVELDEPIQNYLPGVKVPEMDGKKITIRHLAMHNSGIPRMPDNFNPKNPTNPYADYSVQDLYDFLDHCTLKRAPGEQFEYSNVAMGLLGQILSLRSGKSYEQLISDCITKKLDMKNTSIALTPEMNVAKGHHLGKITEHWDFLPSFEGAGALHSNAKDMTKFLAANMGLSKSPLADLMHQCHQKQFIIAPILAVGLGWVLSTSPDAEIIWHNGGTGGFRSYLGFNLKTQKGVVILSNSTEDWTDEFGNLLLDPGFKRPIININKTLANDPDYLNKFAGTYEATIPGQLPKQELQIAVYGKLLGSSLSGGDVGMLYPEEYGIFGVQGFPDGKVHFSFDEHGHISKVQALHVNGTIFWEAAPKK